MMSRTNALTSRHFCQLFIQQNLLTTRRSTMDNPPLGRDCHLPKCPTRCSRHIQKYFGQRYVHRYGRSSTKSFIFLLIMRNDIDIANFGHTISRHAAEVIFLVLQSLTSSPSLTLRSAIFSRHLAS
jgi:hypothetical protein